MPSHDDDVSCRHDVVVIGAGPAGEAAAELGGSLATRSLHPDVLRAMRLPSRAHHI